MYYHNSPTTKNIKMIKKLRAGDMAEAVSNMKAISASYKDILLVLDDLRAKELQADQLIAQFPEKTDEIHKKMGHYYKLMENKLDNFLSVEDWFIKKTIDKLLSVMYYESVKQGTLTYNPSKLYE